MRIRSALVAALLLTSCGYSPPPPPPEPLEFHGPSYTFNVTGITVVEDYKSTKRPPYVEQMSDITPAQAVRKWAALRLTAAGNQNTMEVDIQDASIVRKELPKQKTGVEGMFTTEQTEQYDGSLVVEIKVYSPRNVLPVAHLTVSAQRSLTLPENAAPIDRERLCHQITVDLMHTLEPQLETNIHQYLSPYLM